MRNFIICQTWNFHYSFLFIKYHTKLPRHISALNKGCLWCAQVQQKSGQKADNYTSISLRNSNYKSKLHLARVRCHNQVQEQTNRKQLSHFKVFFNSKTLAASALYLFSYSFEISLANFQYSTLRDISLVKELVFHETTRSLHICHCLAKWEPSGATKIVFHRYHNMSHQTVQRSKKLLTCDNKDGCNYPHEG